MSGLIIHGCISAVKRSYLISIIVCLSSLQLLAQSAGSSGVVQGTVLDPTGAVIPGATVEIQNPVTGYVRSIKTDQLGAFVFRNVPQNTYHLSVVSPGFGAIKQDVDVRTSVPISVSLTMQPAATGETVEVQGGDLLENVPTAHTDVDQALVARIPMESGPSELSNIITLSSPGVVADSNGFFHPLGDHAQTTFTVDNQPISDQQSRVYSNQVPADAVQSFELISGIPQAEYGDKTSLVAVLNTKSGLGQAQPTGSISFGFGSFGSPTGSVDLGYGTSKWGNFVSAEGLRSGRFLDTPEFRPLHAIGNSGKIFDRLDFQPRQADSFHLNLFAARSWFQTPNTFDQAQAGQDQRQKIVSWNIAPSWTHLFSANTLLTVNAFARQDQVNYYPSADPFSDTPATINQNRKLLNYGFRSDVSIVKGHNNWKAGVQVMRTYLRESFGFGITDPTSNPVCLNSSGNPVLDPSITDPNSCASSGFTANPELNPGLVPFDLTRNGSLFLFNDHHTIDQQAAYVQDNMTFGGWTILTGLRYDSYRGLSSAYQFEPRIGVSYNIKSTNTVLRAGYARTLETPYNENLLLSSAAGEGGLAANVFGATVTTPLRPGTRNQYNLGFQQAFGRYAVIDGDFFWKYTDNAFDFNTLGDTPIAFPISWRKSKLNGFSFRITVPEYRGMRVNTVLGHNSAIFYNPENGGLFFDTNPPQGAFRIDHDQKFQQTTNFQYSFLKRNQAWLGFTWRYDSGLVAGEVPDFATALGFTPDQQAAIGLFCGTQIATLNNPITSCSDPNRGSKLIDIPADGTEDDVKNPPRIAPRHLFDIGIGVDNIFRADRHKWSAKFTVVNLTNKVALYNFLSTFSGTHFVSPRSYSGELAFHF